MWIIKLISIVVIVVAVAYVISRISGSEKYEAKTDAMVVGTGCVVIIAQLFAAAISLWLMFMFFSWLF